MYGVLQRKWATCSSPQGRVGVQHIENGHATDFFFFSLINNNNNNNNGLFIYSRSRSDLFINQLVN